ncbi:hypothetical protein PQD69_gp109 [Carnobacterium phage cd4]|uniref:Uncharacterized protein n=1 Tax=Carnobacterium phage cd4 TaxID=2849246 RepID=A0AAE7SP59_9CAUD|nr:hypothetical protein PQD69_gp109 [Carnobacterium phage cd4]QXP45401.1 hypothetical protein cd4_109 [Carnobacterium phage cd4]
MLNENQLDYLNFKVSEAKRAYNYYTDVKLSALALQQKSHMEAYEEVIEGLNGLESDSEVLSSPCRLVEGGEQLTSQELEEEAYRGCEWYFYSLVMENVDCSEEFVVKNALSLGEVFEVLTLNFRSVAENDAIGICELTTNERYGFRECLNGKVYRVIVKNLGLEASSYDVTISYAFSGEVMAECGVLDLRQAENFISSNVVNPAVLSSEVLKDICQLGLECELKFNDNTSPSGLVVSITNKGMFMPHLT